MSPKFRPRSKPKSPRANGGKASWLVSLVDNPWLHRWAYWCSFIAAAAVFAILTVLEDTLPLVYQHLFLAACLLVIGFGNIVLSRSLASQRDALPVFLQVLLEGRGALFEYGPGTFRFSGSVMIGGGVGLLLGRVCFLFASGDVSLWVGIIIGLLVAVAVWVWTWFAFPETGD